MALLLTVAVIFKDLLSASTSEPIQSPSRPNDVRGYTPCDCVCACPNETFENLKYLSKVLAISAYPEWMSVRVYIRNFCFS